MASTLTRDRIEDEEQEYFERRLEELSATGQHWNRSDLYHKINAELDDIRSKRNQD